MKQKTIKEIKTISITLFFILILWFFGPYSFVILENIKNPMSTAKEINGKIFFNSNRKNPYGQSIFYYYKNKIYPVHQGIEPKYNEKLGQILYWGGINKRALYIVDLKNTERFWMIPGTDKISILGFDWSKNGKEICLASKKDGERSYNLHIINTDGKELIQLTNFDKEYMWYPSFPRFSPDGDKIAFQGPNLSKTIKPDWARTPLHPGTLYIINRDGSGMRRLFQTENGEDRWWGGRIASWSPDGKRLVFASHEVGTTIDNIYICNADGSGLRRITNSAYNERNPVFSPEGTKIAYVAYTKGLSSGSEIHIVNTDGNNKYRLTLPRMLRQGPFRLIWATDENPQWYK